MIDRFFKDIALLYNPNANQNRRNIFRKEHIYSLLPPDIEILETKNLDEMENSVKSSLKNKDLVIIAGGDGSVQSAINYFFMFGERIPIFAVLPCGVVNFISRLLLDEINPYIALMKLLACFTRKKVHLTIFDTLKVESERGTKYGFVFANGGLFKVFQMYYDEKSGETGIIKALSIIGKSLVSMILRTPLYYELLSPKKMDVYADGVYMEGEHSAVVVSSVDANFLGLKPFRFFRGGGPLYFVCGQATSSDVFSILPRIYLGRKWKTKGLKTGCFNNVEIKSHYQGHILDGEIFFSEKIKISKGISVKFLVV